MNSRRSQIKMLYLENIPKMSFNEHENLEIRYYIAKWSVSTLLCGFFGWESDLMDWCKITYYFIRIHKQQFSHIIGLNAGVSFHWCRAMWSAVWIHLLLLPDLRTKSNERLFQMYQSFRITPEFQNYHILPNFLSTPVPVEISKFRGSKPSDLYYNLHSCEPNI